MYVLALLIIISNIIGTHTRAVTDTQTIILNVVIEEVGTIWGLVSSTILFAGEVIRVVLLVVVVALGSMFGILVPVLLIALVSCVILAAEAVAFDGLGPIDDGCIAVVFVDSLDILVVVMLKEVFPEVAAVVVLFIDAVLVVVVSKHSITKGNSRGIFSPTSSG